MWILAKSLITLLTQVNVMAPRRSKASDGTIGDEAHATRASDHNPNGRAVVTALDITHDPKNGCNAGVIAEGLRASKNPRIKYVIWNRRIFSSTVSPWRWRAYDGANPHTKHVHISVNDEMADDYPWKIN